MLDKLNLDKLKELKLTNKIGMMMLAAWMLLGHRKPDHLAGA